MLDHNNGFYVMAFHSTSHSILAEKKARENFKISVIPTPRELTNDCGLAIKFLNEDIDKIKAFHNTLEVPTDLYILSKEKVEGKRKVEKIK